MERGVGVKRADSAAEGWGLGGGKSCTGEESKHKMGSGLFDDQGCAPLRGLVLRCLLDAPYMVSHVFPQRQRSIPLAFSASPGLMSRSEHVGEESYICDSMCWSVRK